LGQYRKLSLLAGDQPKKFLKDIHGSRLQSSNTVEFVDFSQFDTPGIIHPQAKTTDINPAKIQATAATILPNIPYKLCKQNILRSMYKDSLSSQSSDESVQQYKREISSRKAKSGSVVALEITEDSKYYECLAIRPEIPVAFTGTLVKITLAGIQTTREMTSTSFNNANECFDLTDFLIMV
jgi:hypothetical protein